MWMQRRIMGWRLERVIDSHLWMLAQQAADLAWRRLCWGLPEVPGVGWLSHHHRCHSPSRSGDRAEAHIKMGMKGLSWPQCKELQWERLLSLNEDKLLWIMVMLQLMHSKHTRPGQIHTQPVTGWLAWCNGTTSFCQALAPYQRLSFCLFLHQQSWERQNYNETAFKKE